MGEYRTWLAGLSDEDFENERYTVTHEAELIGMSHDEAADKTNALDVEALKRPRDLAADVADALTPRGLL